MVAALHDSHARRPGLFVTGNYLTGPAVGACVAKGLETAAELLKRMRELTALTATAERTLLRAQRGGVDTRHASLEIDQSVDAQVELQVLVHGFATGPESEFVRTHGEGLQHASTALSKARRALDDLASRRRGLTAFLFLVGLVLVSLALKIRQISAREQRRADAVLSRRPSEPPT